MIHFINGIWTPGTASPMVSHNPATEQVLLEGNAASKKEVNDAVGAAKAAFALWANRSVDERESALQKYKEKLSAHQEEFAETLSHEVGKPLWESRTEVAAMIAKVDISIEAYRERCPQKSRDMAGKQAVLSHKPHGVAAVFGPYNFPGHLPNGHIIPALLAGNTVVLKPSELTPLAGRKMMQIWEDSGLPPGVINLVQGGKETGVLLANHPDIDALYFTGSWETGSILSQQFGKHPEKILALELGGNNPLVVGEITDIPAAAYLVILSAFLTSGQRCSCARRLIIKKGKSGDDLLQMLQETISKIRIGAWNEDPAPFMGPLVSEEAADHVLAAQKKLIKLGAQPLISANKMERGPAFVSPGLIDVTRAKKRPDTEIFGPLLQVIHVPDLESAIEEANATDYGLSAGILSDSHAEWQTFYHNIRAGIVNWNTPLTGASSTMPFGGVGKSGNHRPSAYYAADYCAYPVATLQSTKIKMPDALSPGIPLEKGEENI